jgi:protein tyrosine/serine phosphatase
MPGDGFGQEKQFRAFNAILEDPERTPVLVHCARGTCRTGASVAFFRFEQNGWTIDDVSAEMERQTYREGWLPGYIYAMVKAKPSVSLLKPVDFTERNRPVATEAPLQESQDAG